MEHPSPARIPQAALTSAPAMRGFVRPTRAVLFWRTCVLWQLFRFLIINLRMTAMIVKSHDTKLPPRA